MKFHLPELVFTDAELGLSPGWDEHLDPNIRRELREARILATRLKEAEAKIAEQERRDAFRRAGIPDDKRGDAFSRVATSDPSHPDALKAEYEELFGAPEPITPDPTLDAEGRIATAGGTQTGTPGTIKFEDALNDPSLTKEQVLELIKQHGSAAGLRLSSDGQL